MVIVSKVFFVRQDITDKQLDIFSPNLQLERSCLDRCRLDFDCAGEWLLQEAASARTSTDIVHR